MPTSSPLRRTLTTADTFSIATGAMFSSGFFLLPGIAAAMTGTSVVLAYLVAAALMIPAMLSQAELSTAMPRSGGAYFFVDRAMGPLVGSMAGFSTWVALVLKVSFALVGLGATLQFILGWPILPVAIAGGVFFTAINLQGAQRSAGLQRWLVAALLLTLLVFLGAGASSALAGALPLDAALSTQAFFSGGVGGFAATVGLVSISYAGLTKVASVAEEVKDPDNALPKGMFLALAVTTSVYALGVLLVLAVLPEGALHSALAPVSLAAEVVFSSRSAAVGAALISIAAISAFVSTANAGILAAARYPLAMARDGLVPAALSELSSDGTPRRAVLLTGGVVVAALCLDIASLAKLAAAVQLVVFALLCLSVIVMRESGLVGYSTGFRSPLYPWMQIVGVAVSLALIQAMGLAAVCFTLGLMGVALAAYVFFTRGALRRRGALPHLFARMGEQTCPEVERELAGMLVERVRREGDDARVASLRLEHDGPLGRAIGRRLSHLQAELDGRAVAIMERPGDASAARWDPHLRVGDVLTLIGDPADIERLLALHGALGTTESLPPRARREPAADSTRFVILA